MRLIVASVACLGCGSKEEARPTPAPPPPPVVIDATSIDAFAVWPATLEDRSIDLAWHDLKTTLTGRVPAGWISRSQGSFAPPNDNPSPNDPHQSYFFGNMSCDGECDDRDMQQSMAEFWQNAEKRWPIGSDKPEDGKLDVVTLEEGAFADGKYKAGRYKAVKITRPPGSPLPAYLERLTADCVRHATGDKHFIYASVTAPLEHEATLWPLLLEACKTPWYRAATSTDRR